MMLPRYHLGCMMYLSYMKCNQEKKTVHFKCLYIRLVKRTELIRRICQSKSLQYKTATHVQKTKGINDELIQNY